MDEIKNVIDSAIASSVYGVNHIERGGLERVIRCFSCGDSEDQTHGHLSISRTAPYLFKCYRCGYSGSVNETFLKNIGVTITPEIHEALEINKTAVAEWAKSRKLSSSRQVETFLKTARNHIGLNVPVIYTGDLKGLYYEYLCNRFDYEFNADELNKFKVILDLRKFAEINYLTSFPIRDEDLFTLSDNYVGFNNYSSSVLIFRDASGNAPLGRYRELKMVSSPYRFYTVSGTLDLNNPHLHIITAEGIFDIIGLWLKYPELQRERNVIFTAMLGKGFHSMSEFMMHLGFTEQVIDIFSDDDVNPGLYIYKYRKYTAARNLNFTVSLMYNEIGHDFGVPASKIIVNKKKVL